MNYLCLRLLQKVICTPKNIIMKKTLLLFLLIAIINITSNAQTILNGFVGNPLIAKDKLYSVYSSNGVTQLVQFDGTNNFKILIANLGKYSKGCLFTYKDNLYFDCFFSGINQIARYDGLNFTLIPMPNNGTLYRPNFINVFVETVLLNDNLYFTYYDKYKNQLARLDGNSIVNVPISINFQLSDGNILNYNNALYFNVIGADSKSALAKFDGNTISIVPPILSTVGSQAFPQIVFNNGLFINYLISHTDGDEKNQLAKYDGTNIVLIPNPDKIGNVNEANSVVYDNSLYFEYQSWTNTSGSNQQLAKYNSNAITLIPNPTKDGRVYFNGKNNILVYNNAIYFEYYDSQGGVVRGENGKRQLAKYDGTKITLIPNPDVEGKINGAPFIFNNNLYTLYSNYNGEAQLAKFNSDNGAIQIIEYKPTVAENTNSIFDSDNYNDSDLPQGGVRNIIYTTLTHIDKNTFVQGRIIIKIDQDGNITGVTPLSAAMNDKIPQNVIDLLNQNFTGKKILPYNANGKNYPSYKKYFISSNYGNVSIMEKF